MLVPDPLRARRHSDLCIATKEDTHGKQGIFPRTLCDYGHPCHGLASDRRQCRCPGSTEVAYLPCQWTGRNSPPAEVIFDASGNLYGTTSLGGVYNSGTVFELMPNSAGGWTQKTLHSFSSNLIDGNDPGGGLTFSKGSLYGTTYKGQWGCAAGGVVIGCGAVFEQTPQSNGGYKEQVIYTFQSRGGDATFPRAVRLTPRGVNPSPKSSPAPPPALRTVFPPSCPVQRNRQDRRRGFPVA
jgi:uncharacterized repeat protein (TIGR03803 family)